MSQNRGKDLNQKESPQQTRILRPAFAFIGINMKNIINMEHFPGKRFSAPDDSSEGESLKCEGSVHPMILKAIIKIRIVFRKLLLRNIHTYMNDISIIVTD